MSVEQKQMQMMVRREMARRPMDCSMVDVSASHGVIYLRGTLRQAKGHAIDLKQELNMLITILKQKAGIRDVVPELQII